jgi:anaerobic selenocysteine-containing dehydrogenase
MSTKEKQKITRREFLKTSGTVAAVALLGNQLVEKSKARAFTHNDLAQSAQSEEMVYSWCRQCALPPCGIQVRVKDGVAIKVEGNPKSPNNQGTLCSRGNATLAAVYNPYRVKTPIKRTNPKRGMDEDPGWVEISWEEAYSTITEQMKAVLDKDPRRFLWFNGFARSGSMLEGMEFCEAFGTPNYIETDGPNCSVHFGASLLLGNFVGARYDPAFTNYLIQMGDGSNANDAYAGVTRSFVEAVKRGMKVVTIDPKLTVEGSKGEWVPIRPGTDLAFVLAMQNVIVHELERFDIDFIKNRTNAGYLVGPDGYYLRDQASGKPLIWDMQSQQALPFDDPAFSAASAGGPPAAAAAPAAAGGAPPAPVPVKQQLANMGLMGEFQVDGVTGVPGFQLYMQSIQDYTPEWAESITTIPAGTIRRIAREFVDAAMIGSTVTIDGSKFPYRPACIQGGRGSITQFYGGHFHCATIITNMLVGALDVPGGGRGDLGPQHKCTPIPMALKPDADGTVAPKVEAVGRPFEFPPNRLDGKTFFPYSHDNPHITIDAILEPQKYSLDYSPEVMLAWAGNPVLRCFQPDRVLQAFDTIPFIFALSYSLDEPSWIADIVLPESAGLERYSAGQRGVMMQTEAGLKQAVYMLIAQPAIQPVYDSRQPDEVFMELADRLGILYGPGGMNDKINSGTLTPVKLVDPFLLDLNKRYSVQELAELIVKSGFGPDHSVAAYRNTPEYPVKILPQKSYYPYGGFPQGQTRYAIYIERLKKMGDDLIANLDRVDAHLPGFSDDVLRQHYSPVVHWIEKPDDTPAEFNMFGVNWKTAQYSFGVGGTADNPWLDEVAQFDPYLHVICLHPSTAAASGIQEGDLIWVESPFGKVQGAAHLSEAFHPEVAGIGGLFGHTSPGMNPTARKGIHFNSLMSPRVEDVDPLGGGFDGAPRVKIYKA